MPVDPRRMRPRKEPGAPPAATLPPQLAGLFVPNAPLEHKLAIQKKKSLPYTGIGYLVSEFETTAPPARVVHETPLEIKARRKKEKLEAFKAAQAKAVAEYKPKEQITGGNAFNTLFVTGLSYETTEETIKTAFSEFGKVVSVKLVKDREGKSRGYAFVEYSEVRELKTAYKHGRDMRKIDGRRVTVDVERGRTVEGWVPRRLGGGLGRGRPAKLKKAAMLEKQRLAMASRFSGGGRFGGGRFGGPPPPRYVGGGGRRRSRSPLRRR